MDCCRKALGRGLSSRRTAAKASKLGRGSSATPACQAWASEVPCRSAVGSTASKPSQQKSSRSSQHICSTRTLAALRAAGGAVGPVGATAGLEAGAEIQGHSGRTVVVAVGDDQLSWEAVRYTVTELYREGDVLHLLHVIPRDSIAAPNPPLGLASSSYSSESLDFEEVLQDHANQFIQETMMGLATAARAKCEVDIVRGGCGQSIGAAICKAADQLGAALIVVPGWKSLSAFDQFFQQDRTYGSYVAQHATRPCLVYQHRPVRR